MKRLMGLLVLGGTILCLAACSGKNNTAVSQEIAENPGGSGSSSNSIWDDYGASSNSSDNFWAQNGVGTDSGSSNSNSASSNSSSNNSSSSSNNSSSDNSSTGNFWADNGVVASTDENSAQYDDEYYEDQPSGSSRFEGSPILGVWVNEDAAVPYTYVFYEDGTVEYGSSGGASEEEYGTFDFDGTTVTIRFEGWADSVYELKGKKKLVNSMGEVMKKR